jgi:uncharacterized YigZ family protein
MQFVKDTFTQTLEIKQSKFIAFLTPYSNYSTKLNELKVQHPKARHFVVAYRYLNEFEQIIEHSSDDGEPKGTSGKPSLMVLQGNELIDSAVIVVRYFGGTKLGTGGLVRAYGDAVNLVIESSELFEYKKRVTRNISFEYSDLRLVEYETQKHSIEIVEKSFENCVVFEVNASEEDMNLFLLTLERSIKIL